LLDNFEVIGIFELIIQYIDADGRIILKWTLGRYGLGMWTGFIWLKVGNRWRTLVNTVMNLWVP
jgi:hypothetical protein